MISIKVNIYIYKYKISFCLFFLIENKPRTFFPASPKYVRESGSNNSIQSKTVEILLIKINYNEVLATTSIMSSVVDIARKSYKDDDSADAEINKK